MNVITGKLFFAFFADGRRRGLTWTDTLEFIIEVCHNFIERKEELDVEPGVVNISNTTLFSSLAVAELQYSWQVSSWSYDGSYQHKYS